jgi:hypothetical protein
MHWTLALERAALNSGVRKVIPKSESQQLLGAIEELLAPNAWPSANHARIDCSL